MNDDSFYIYNKYFIIVDLLAVIMEMITNCFPSIAILTLYEFNVSFIFEIAISNSAEIPKIENCGVHNHGGVVLGPQCFQFLLL